MISLLSTSDTTATPDCVFSLVPTTGLEVSVRLVSFVVTVVTLPKPILITVPETGSCFSFTVVFFISTTFTGQGIRCIVYVLLITGSFPIICLKSPNGTLSINMDYTLTFGIFFTLFRSLSP